MDLSRGFRKLCSIIACAAGVCASPLPIAPAFADPVELRALPPNGLPFLAVKTPPRSISVVAGVPLTSTYDPTGGFGDVVSNIHMANAFKRRYPEMQVQLIFWLREDPRPSVAKVSDIIKATLPTVDVSKAKHYRPQTVDGVDIYVIPHQGEEKLQAALEKK